MIDVDNFYIEILIQLFLIFSFLTLFYFFYVIGIERDQFSEGINYAIDSIFDDIRANVPFHKDLLKTIKIEDTKDTQFETKYPKIDKDNSDIFLLAMEILVAWFIAVILLLIILYLLGMKIKLGGILFRNLIIIVCIGLTEYAFLVNVGAKYKTIDANVIKYNIFSSIYRNTLYAR
jgi:hypothetical protein